MVLIRPQPALRISGDCGSFFIGLDSFLQLKRRTANAGGVSVMFGIYRLLFGFFSHGAGSFRNMETLGPGAYINRFVSEAGDFPGPPRQRRPSLLLLLCIS